MSQRSSFVNGYGITVAGTLDITSLILFIKNHIDTALENSDALLYEKTGPILDEDGNPRRISDEELAKTKERISAVMGDLYEEKLINAGLRDFSDFCEKFPEAADALDLLTDDAEYRHYIDIAADIISAESGIRIQYEPADTDKGCIGEASILLPDALPWLYNNKEKSLTEESFREEMRPFFDELELNVDNIEYLEIEYYG